MIGNIERKCKRKRTSTEVLTCTVSLLFKKPSTMETHLAVTERVNDIVSKPVP